MTRHPLWLVRFCRLLMVLFDLTEERPASCTYSAGWCVAMRAKRKGKLGQ